MIQWLFPSLAGGKNGREVNRIRPTVARINAIEKTLQSEPFEKLAARTSAWRGHLARYHPLNAPPRVRLEAMDEAERVAAAGVIESRLTVLRGEFPSLPSEVSAAVESIEAAKVAFHEIEENFAKSRAKYLEKLLPEAYAVVKNAARRLCGTGILVNGQPMTWDMVHFDVQLIGGTALHRGLIAEMQTGEGKTLVATLPVYLNALAGLGVHVVTVNDYLAQRDSEWMGALFRFLGLSVGCIQNRMQSAERRAAYACDITYGTNSEFGFDYLRDNGIATTRGEQVQRGHYLAIIDEVDSILIDDARTPLIITGASTREEHPFEAHKPLVEKLVKRQAELCNQLAAEAKRHLAAGDTAAAGLALFKVRLGQPRNRQFLRFMENPEIRRLVEKTELSFQRQAFQKDLFKLKEELFFAIDEKVHGADLMEKGRGFLAPGEEDSFTVPDVGPLLAAIDSNAALSPEAKAEAKSEIHHQRDLRAAKIHGINQLLKAYCLYERDVHYVVRDEKVTIIDESTGREMPGRRWSDGLHQAVESKERVAIEKENRTYATITIQNYFRLYEKLAGMTGTAETEAAEFHDIYKLDVLPIPTNAPNLRTDENDLIFKTRREKYNAVIAAIEGAHAAGQPVLVGTASVEASETLSRMLKRAKIPHAVLNAKFHRQEAEIVALAGQRGAVTVSTNMAGRGTDIKLGDGVTGLGGLFVVGTERHPSRRVDRQLRGRCSRQGDPGRSRFFISLEDDLMRHHGAPGHMAAMMEQAGSVLRNSTLAKLAETAQQKVEQRDYKGRKQVLDFDDVMNLQREIVYGYRNDVLGGEDTRGLVRELFGEDCQAYEGRVRPLPVEWLEEHERRTVLAAIDRHWQEHLAGMDELREGVYLRSQGQKDLLVEYKNEAYEMFVSLMESIKHDARGHLLRFAESLDALPTGTFAVQPTARPARRALLA